MKADGFPPSQHELVEPPQQRVIQEAERDAPFGQVHGQDAEGVPTPEKGLNILSSQLHATTGAPLNRLHLDSNESALDFLASRSSGLQELREEVQSEVLLCSLRSESILTTPKPGEVLSESAYAL